MELQAPRRMEQLQFFRFVAFFWIFCTHTNSTLGRFIPWLQMFHTTGGQGGVYFFFVLSGFLKGYSSYQREVTLSVGAIWDNLWGKVKRIYPLYVGVLLFYLAGTDSFLDPAEMGLGAMARERGISFLEQLFLVQAWDKTHCIDYNYAAWFLSVLMSLVLLDVPVTWLYHRWDGRKNAGWIFGGLTAAFLVAEFLLRIRTAQMEPYYNLVFPPYRIPEYIGGLTMGYFVRSIYPGVARRMRSPIVWTLLEAAALALVAYGAQMTEEFWGILLLHWTLPVFCLIFVFSFGGGYLSRLLRLPPLRLLGELVFPCYIMHTLVVGIMIARCSIDNATPAGMDMMFVYTLGLLLVLSYIVTYILPNGGGRK